MSHRCMDRRDATTRRLISAFRTSTDDRERTEALEEVTRLHLPLARSLAHRYSGRGLDREDLEQVAFLALLKAVYRFDLDMPTEFGAYATPTITGELRRHFRDQGWLVRPPRELQERRQLVSSTMARLEQDLGHEPSEDELAEELELSPDQVREAQVAGANLRPASLDATTQDGDRSIIDLLESRGPADGNPADDDGIVVRSALERLPAHHQQLVSLRFTRDLTQAEIAEQMGLSAMQVSRLLRKILGELRVVLDAAGVESA